MPKCSKRFAKLDTTPTRASAELGEVMRRDEIEQAELVVKVSNVHELIHRDLGVEPHEMGPAPDVDLPDGVTLDSRVAELEARITSLGPINPLALEEFSALEDRYKELDAQVSDVRHARRELQEVLRALDEEIMQTFTAAFADVNEHFSSLIAMLFPGGQGRLNMSEPEDPLEHRRRDRSSSHGTQRPAYLAALGWRTLDGRPWRFSSPSFAHGRRPSI